jgi:hypothetical protein
LDTFGFHDPATMHYNVLDEFGYFDEANKTLCRIVGEKLAEVYPGRPWGVDAQIESGIVKICVQGFPQWPFVLHVATLKGDPTLKSVVRAGGELLERFKMSREKFSIADWQAANGRHDWLFNRNKQAPV